MTLWAWRRKSRAGWAVAGVSAGGSWGSGWSSVGWAGWGRHGFGDFAENMYPKHRFRAGLPGGRRADSVAPAPATGSAGCTAFAGWPPRSARVVRVRSARPGRTGPGRFRERLPRGWVSSWIWVCGFSPPGQRSASCVVPRRSGLPSRRWWPVAVVSWGLAVGLVVISARVCCRAAGESSGQQRQTPLGVPLPRFLFERRRPGFVFVPLLVVAILGSLAALTVRLPAWAGRGNATSWLAPDRDGAAGRFLRPRRRGDGGSGGESARLVAIPLVAAVGRFCVAVLRSRLGGAEVAVRRSLVYGWLLAAGLAVVRPWVVLVLDAVLRWSRTAGWSPSPRPGSVVGCSTMPLRLRLQRRQSGMLSRQSCCDP